MEKPLYRIPHELVCDGDFVMNTDIINPESNEMVRRLSMDAGDLLIASYPRSGTTWMQELAYLVYSRTDIETAKRVSVTDRCRFLEFNSPINGLGVEKILAMPHPWMMKSHLPVRYLKRQLDAGKVKVIVVLRNPKDNLVSYYHFYKMSDRLGHFPGSFSDFFDLVERKHLAFGDIFDWQLGWWGQRQNKNILYVKYEDMQKDIRSVIRQVAQHCGKPISEEDMEKIAGHVSFSSMKMNPMVNLTLKPGVPESSWFLRKGQVGEWKTFFSPGQNAYFEKVYQDRYQPEGLNFDFELTD